MPTEPIIFNSEASLWETLRSGERNFDPRRWDLEDQRIVALTEFTEWKPTVSTIDFRNKATGEILTMEYKGVEFLSDTPKWVFLMLGECRGVTTP